MALNATIRLSCIQLNSANPVALAQFFEDALGFRRCTANPAQDDAVGALTLALGPSRLKLMASSGRPYPDHIAGWNPLFQHCAIVTTDMAASMARLRRHPDWTPISTHGAERLPLTSGGVTAFKFRDPEGHPLELIAFPQNQAADGLYDGDGADHYPCIDHSAISVADTPRSIAFYTRLGLNVGSQSLNHGIEQDRLDALSRTKVEVTALETPSRTKPHVELLCYRGAFDRTATAPELSDIATTRLVFTLANSKLLATIRTQLADRLIPPAQGVRTANLLLRDPDGHVIEIGTAA